ncbi:MAG: DNA-deoxyinosine glycosylase [Caulobacter sp.]|nr:DNA-deoxyinosine glycosylase [Vitreoscilla sp.]
MLQGLPPVIAPDARLVVLGSFPGVASLAAQQYYGHPRNYLWPLLSALWDEDLVALDYPARVDALRRHRVGLWDVYRACEREGSLDSAIRKPVPNDLAQLRGLAPGLQAVAHNGAESGRSRRLVQVLGVDVHTLPSTSPANAAWSFERKLSAWREVFSRYDLA